MKLDYSALSQPVTPEDIAAFKQWRGSKTRSKAERIFIVTMMVAGGFLIFLALLRIIGDPTDMGPIITVLFAVILTSIVIAANRANLKKQVRLFKFAQANNIKPIFDVAAPLYDGMIFDEGHSRTILHGLQFADGTEIGNYQYVTGSGKNRQTHSWGYARVKLSRKLPHMVLDARSNNFLGMSNLPDSFRGQKLSLEGDFDQHYTLHAPAEYGRDALYIFTPDVMAALIDLKQTYDIEIIDDNLILYAQGKITLDTEQGLAPLLAVIDKLGTEIRDQSHRYADERVADAGANIVAEPGRRLKSGVSASTIIVIVIVVIYFVFVFMN